MSVAIVDRMGAVLYASETAQTIAEAVVEAAKGGANLSGADLSEANLSGADLSEANLSEANLSEANLSEANLSEANLSGANLSRANISGADLSGANLSRANLNRAKQPVIQIQGSCHQVVAVGRDVRIGCHRRTLERWLETYAAIGIAETYTSEQIDEYGEHLRYIQRWVTRQEELRANTGEAA